MSIPNIVNPVGDLSTGFVVTPAVWNILFDTLYNYLNAVSTPAINALITAPSAPQGAQAFFNARLSASTLTPYPKADVTSSTMYLCALGGNLVGLYDTTNTVWVNRTMTAEPSLAVPTATRDLADVFAYWTGTAVALEAALYTTVTATNNPASNAAPVAINVAATTGFAVGDVISITSAGGSEESVITAVVLNTSITVDSLEFSHTAPVLHSNFPSQALTFQDGVPVKATDRTRRYVGTILIIGNQITDSRTAGRCIGNYYNRAMVPVRSLASGNYTIAASTTQRAQGLAGKVVGVERILFVTAQLPSAYTITRLEVISNNSANKVVCYNEVDHVDVPIAVNVQDANPHSLSFAGVVATGGRHVIDDFIQNSVAAVITFQAQAGVSNNGNAIQYGAYTDGLVLN